MVFLKIIGVLLIIVGYFLIRHFPEGGDFQHSGITLGGILIGATLLLIGIGLLILG